MSSEIDQPREQGTAEPGHVKSDKWPSVCILILNWNGRELLERQLPLLEGLEYPGEYQIVLVDNGSTDNSLAFVESQFPGVRCIANSQNLGFSRGMNRGLEQTDAEVTVLLNTDVEVRQDWLTELVRPMLADPSIGITGSKLYFPGGTHLQHAGAMLEYPLAIGRHRFYRQVDIGQADEPCEVDYVTGASMAIRRKVLEEVGSFDELFSPFYYEEVDLCQRARQAGLKVLYVPASVAVHHESSSSGQIPERQYMDLNRNRVLYAAKHYSPTQLLNEFMPAEEASLSSIEGIHQLRWMRRVYMEIMLFLPLRPFDEEKAPVCQPALARLADLAASLPLARGKEDSVSDKWLLDKAHVRELPFTSRTPVVGPLLAWFRARWNNVSTKWYVRPLLAQQNEYNRLLAEVVQDLEARLIAQDRDQTFQNRQLAELATEVKQLKRVLRSVDG